MPPLSQGWPGPGSRGQCGRQVSVPWTDPQNRASWAASAHEGSGRCPLDPWPLKWMGSMEGRGSEPPGAPRGEEFWAGRPAPNSPESPC